MPVKKTKSETSPTVAATNAANSKRVFDIAKPGTLPSANASATATARPIIVTNRVMVQDPMMTTPGSTPAQPNEPEEEKILPTKSSPDFDLSGVSAAKPTDEAVPPAEPKSKPVVPPIVIKEEKTTKTVPVIKTESAAASGDAASSKTAPIVPSVEEAPTETPEPAKPEETKPEPAAAAAPAEVSKEAPAKDAEADQGDATQSESDLAKETAKQEAEAKAQQELDKLADDKTYFLPITTRAERRSRNVAIIGFILILLLVAAWVDIALDAGFMTIPGIEPLTHFFNN